MERIFAHCIGVVTTSQTPRWGSQRVIVLSHVLELFRPHATFTIAYPWGVGPYQALGFTKVWGGKARIPSISSMWHSYPGAGHELNAVPATGEGTLELLPIGDVG
jgi:hypothetical protein